MDSELWARLTLEGNFELIDKLSRVEKGDVGFSTVIVPKEGFSADDLTHNMVLDWLQIHGANILNVGLEITRLETALRGYQGD
jgi:hypothetical protein